MNKTFAKRTIAYILTIAVAGTSLVVPTRATLQDDLSDLQDRQQEIEDVISGLKQDKANLEANVEALDAELNEVSLALYNTEQELASVKKKIKKNKKKLKKANASIKSQYASMKLRIQFMYENGNQQMIDLIFSSESISDFLNKAEYISELSNYDREMLNKMKKTRNTIKKTETALEEQQASLVTLKAQQTQDKQDIETLVSAKQQEIAKYETDIELQQAASDDIDVQIGNVEDEIAEMESIEAQRQAEQESREEASRQAAAQQQDDSGSQEQTTQSYTPSGNYTWPLPGYYSLSSYFGYRSDPFGGGSEYHSGIDIPAPSGTPIVAAASGTVAWANYSTSAGNWTGIDHGNGIYTVYMHQSAILVSVGQTVTQGQTIGLVGTTGSSTGNHLHFSVRLNGSYVDPLNYVSY